MSSAAAKGSAARVAGTPRPTVTPLFSLERRARQDRAQIECCVRCYGAWLRARLLEHWRGEQFWAELDRGDFRMLSAERHPRGNLFADVVALIACGSENLTIIIWALETGRPVEAVVDILTVLDVNARRVPCFSWLTPALRCTRAS
jgi:hypothetical protein